MCDYSLGLVASRPAKVGDELVKRSSRTPSREDSPQSESQTWQCAFYPARRSRSKRKSSTSAFFAPFPIMKFGRLEKKVAQFRQINVGKPRVHHDALEFPDGETVLLTQLCEGQHATVLQLPASRPVNAAEGQKRDSLVN